MNEQQIITTTQPPTPSPSDTEAGIELQSQQEQEQQEQEQHNHDDIDQLDNINNNNNNNNVEQHPNNNNNYTTTTIVTIDGQSVTVPSILLQGPKYEDEFAWEYDPYSGSPESKYSQYELPVAHDEGDRAMSIKLCSFRRPHMRALHCAWISFFLAFTIWFAPAPLLNEIGTTLSLSKSQLWTSSITNDVTAIVMRIIIGPICDAHGARIPMAIVLCVASIPCAMIGLVQNEAGLAVTRFFIGIAGSSFVMAQFWPSRMFSREIAGTANGIVGGWGNLGGAFTQVLMGRILFPLFRDHVYHGNAEKSWRIICIIPASVAFCWGAIVWKVSDDAPVGNYNKMRKSGTMDRLYYTTSLRMGAKLNTWILYIQYACSFGVELVMNNGAVLYFHDEFGLNTEDAATIGFLYGSMNIFARGAGGWMSDKLNLKFGLRGRLWLQTILLIMEGVLIIVFSKATTLGGAVATMCAFSVFTQSAEGAIYGVVPYVSKLYTGSVSGLVGAGGNVGSVIYGFMFRSLPYREAFLWMGGCVMCSSILTIWINIPCHAGLLKGEDNHAVINARRRFMARIEQNAVLHGTSRHRAVAVPTPQAQEAPMHHDDNNHEEESRPNHSNNDNNNGLQENEAIAMEEGTNTEQDNTNTAAAS